MKIYHFILGTISVLSLFLAQPLVAQQDNSLPPPLRRPATSAGTTQPTTPTPPVETATQKTTEPQITTFDDWVHRCSEIIVEEKPFTQCELLQLQQQQQGENMINILILAFAQVAPKEGENSAQFMLTSVVPLDVFLPDGIRFLVDSRAVMHLPFRNCNPNGCWSQIVVEEAVLEAFKRKNEGLARFTIVNGQEVEVKFSLKGLTAGLDALQKS